MRRRPNPSRPATLRRTAPCTLARPRRGHGLAPPQTRFALSFGLIWSGCRDGLPDRERCSLRGRSSSHIRCSRRGEPSFGSQSTLRLGFATWNPSWRGIEAPASSLPPATTWTTSVASPCCLLWSARSRRHAFGLRRDSSLLPVPRPALRVARGTSSASRGRGRQFLRFSRSRDLRWRATGQPVPSFRVVCDRGPRSRPPRRHSARCPESRPAPFACRRGGRVRMPSARGRAGNIGRSWRLPMAFPGEWARGSIPTLIAWPPHFLVSSQSLTASRVARPERVLHFFMGDGRFSPSPEKMARDGRKRRPPGTELLIRHGPLRGPYGFRCSLERAAHSSVFAPTCASLSSLLHPIPGRETPPPVVRPWLGFEESWQAWALR